MNFRVREQKHSVLRLTLATVASKSSHHTTIDIYQNKIANGTNECTVGERMVPLSRWTIPSQFHFSNF